MKADFRHLLTLAVDHLSGLTTISDPDFRLEQAVFNEETRMWEIVVSFLIREPQQPSIIPSLKVYHLLQSRTYKKLILSEDYEIKGFYMYENEK